MKEEGRLFLTEEVDKNKRDMYENYGVKLLEVRNRIFVIPLDQPLTERNLEIFQDQIKFQEEHKIQVYHILQQKGKENPDFL